MATLTLTVNLVQYGLGARQRRSLKRAFLAAQYALGERMYTAGIDDGQLGAQIAAYDREIGRSATQALLAERRKLILLLAAAALAEEGPLPGADAEYERARTAQAALHADD